MPEKKPNKTQIMTLTIAGAGLIIVILVVLLLTGGSSKNTGATTNETGATAKASSSSSSTKTYVEGKDYSIKYSNDGIVDKATLDSYLTDRRDYASYIDKNGHNYSKIEVLYDKQKNLFISKNYKVGNDEPDIVTSYSITDKKIIGPITNGYDNLPVVYTWTNLTK
ncbi:alanyl-tRNA synthetase [Leuconostoc citreum]